VPRERIISSDTAHDDNDAVINALRPQHLNELVGQQSVVDQLRIALDAARHRREPLEHVLLDGPPGLGKTTLAHIIANELGTQIRITSGPAIVKQGDLMSMLTNMETHHVLFIDEVHRLSKPVEEFLYPAMEDFRVDFTIESGLSGRTVNFALNRFTLIGATTRAGLLSGALRDRFGLVFHLDFYSTEEVAEILRRSARRLEVPYDPNALQRLAGRARGTPRVANRLLRRTRDFAQVRGHGRLDVRTVNQALDILQIDEHGLDEQDRGYLRALIHTYNGGPAGVEALAASLGQERDTLEDVVEPFLLQTGFVARTRQGRVATRAAYEHLGVPYREPTGGRDAADQDSLF
jgi:Holliday junction DNA helicase RuvB